MDTQPNLLPAVERCKKILHNNKSTLELHAHQDLAFRRTDSLKDFEILGHEKNIEKIRRVFQDTEAKVNVIQAVDKNKNNGKSTSNPSITSTDYGGGSVVKKMRRYSRDFRDNVFNTLDFNKSKKASGGIPDIVVQSYEDTGIYLIDPKDILSDNDSSSDSENETSASSSSSCSPASPMANRVVLTSSESGISPEIQNRRDIIRVQNRITNLGDRTFISPNRWFIRECAWFKKVGKKGPTSKVEFFFFNDLLVIAKITQRRSQLEVNQLMKVKFRKALDLCYLDIQAIPDSSAGQNLLRLQYYKQQANRHKKQWKRTYSADTKEHRDEVFVELCNMRDSVTKFLPAV